MNRERFGDEVERARAAASSVVIAVLAGVAGVIGSFAVAGLTPGFVAAPISGVLARRLPAFVITTAIVYLGSLGQQLNLLTAIGLSVAAFALLAAAARWLAARVDQPLLSGPLAALATGLLAVGLTGRPAPAVGAAAAVGLVVGLASIGRLAARAVATTDAGRRQALQAVAGAIGVAVLGVGVRAAGRRQDADTTSGSSGGPSTGGSGVGAGDAGDGGDGPDGGGETDDDGDGNSEPTRAQALLSEASEKSLAVEGMDPLVSEGFYEVDIAAVNPDLSAEDWTLSFTGAVAEERTIDYETLTGMESEERFVTLRCVGEDLNGHKMDNALWTGTPIAPLLEELDIESGCGCVMLRAADDYYEEFPLAALERGFLAWGMNGRGLPRGHGHPVRALIPGHWGEINVKWLTEIEFLEREVDGFWEERGWHGTGPVNTVAKLHAVNRLGDDRIQVGGHAYAGTRGISDVHVSLDGGVHWERATLSEELPGEDVWRQWAYEYDSPGERHEVTVRAVDGNGEVQSPEESPSFPSGPSGWVSRRVQG